VPTGAENRPDTDCVVGVLSRPKRSWRAWRDCSAAGAASSLAHARDRLRYATASGPGSKIPRPVELFCSFVGSSNLPNRLSRMPIIGTLATIANIGAPGEIRTPDLLVRSQTLYPTELQARRKRMLCRGRFRRQSRIPRQQVLYKSVTCRNRAALPLASVPLVPRRICCRNHRCNGESAPAGARILPQRITGSLAASNSLVDP
jgi:hypothetical protein